MSVARDSGSKTRGDLFLCLAEILISDGAPAEPGDEAALARLEADGSPYYGVLRGHLAGIKQDRQKLWLARRKLVAGIRHEIASTCGSHVDFERELAHLARFLTASQQG